MLSILVFESFDSRLLHQIASTFFKLQLHKLLEMMGRIYFPAFFLVGGEKCFTLKHEVKARELCGLLLLLGLLSFFDCSTYTIYVHGIMLVCLKLGSFKVHSGSSHRWCGLGEFAMWTSQFWQTGVGNLVSCWSVEGPAIWQNRLGKDTKSTWQFSWANNVPYI
jgi:hypothetical protein